ncbi:hypothetical protein CAPTEDRAFT_212824 [Capitella teleta]|uniref:Solute carrier organic anion transporter family member n=1 Tax=Capitella teleta TaxID=283909 RepID=R7V8S9_CAPTE|nr:hypothetical protein CAPTEDRAFT_212824 [Capitella teleta]|eukprot:ELU15238.1 hypothetical protein CAPTEDRAFT_212824 [Capitella teleta]
MEKNYKEEEEDDKQIKGLEAEQDANQDGPETDCGCAEWRPSCLQPCASVGFFTGILSLITIFGNMNYSYYASVISQIEKCFGLSSSMTGFMKNVDNISTIICILIFSHFFRYSNKPRIFAVSSALTAVGIFTFAVPHFIYGSGDVIETITNSTEIIRRMSGLCNDVDDAGRNCDGAGNANQRSFNTGAFAIFLVSEFIQGMAQSPQFSLGVTYMDDNSENTPQHLGVMFGTRAFAPVLGFLLGAWASNIYVDLSDPNLDSQDPRWVGAWWIGYVISALCSFLPVIPLALFPQRMKGSEAQEEQGEFKEQLKDMPKALLRLIKNPVIVFVTCGTCFNVYLSGFSTFMPKYIEQQFQTTASMASILTGVISVFNYCLGPIISGGLVARFRMTPVSTIRFVVFCHIFGVLGFVINMFIGCPDSEWSANFQNRSADCNLGCTCDPEEFIPVCGSDGLNYYSPCLAGCQHDQAANTSSLTKLYTDCLCISNGTGTAVSGECPMGCPMMVPYVVIYCVATFITSMSFVPMLTTIIRTCDKRDKALGMALIVFVIMIVTFPAPMLFGMVIDTACLVKQVACGREGACLFYKRSDFRLKFHGLAAVVKFGATVAFSIGWYKIRRLDIPLPADDRDQEENEAEVTIPLKRSEENENV